MQTNQRSTSGMAGMSARRMTRRVTRRMNGRMNGRIGLLGLAAGALLLGACQSGATGVIVSVQNLSSVPVQAAVQPMTAGSVPGDAVTLDVPIGEERAASFTDGADSGGVSIDIAPKDRTLNASLQRFLLQGPGPYLIEVTGNANALNVSRTDPIAARGPDVPPDPRSQGFTNDLPPVNPSR
ncbi:MAG: hypothetical protein AAF235_03375 [Planctomycetota bacterium]